MQTGQKLIRPLLPKMCAYDCALAFYSNFSDLNFADDLCDYLRTGFVWSRPTMFAMAKIIRLDSGEFAWFVRIAVGNFKEILSVLPAYLPKICWVRNNKRNLRVYSTDRLYKWARYKFREVT